MAVEVTLVWQLEDATAYKICHFGGLQKRKVTTIVSVFYQKRRLKIREHMGVDIAAKKLFTKRTNYIRDHFPKFTIHVFPVLWSTVTVKNLRLPVLSYKKWLISTYSQLNCEKKMFCSNEKLLQ